MAKYKPMHIIKRIKGNFAGQSYSSVNGTLSVGPPKKTGKTPKTKADHIADCSCAAWKSCDELYQILKRDPEWLWIWRQATIKPYASCYDHFMTDCLTYYNAGCGWDALPCGHGGFSWEIHECPPHEDYGPPDQ